MKYISHILPFKVYLSAELGRLRIHSVSVEFLQRVKPELIAGFKLPGDAEGLAKLFTTQAGVESFVEGLSEESLRCLTKRCDQKWRNNGVYARIVSADHW